MLSYPTSSSLWTTIHLSHSAPPLPDMTLPQGLGNRLTGLRSSIVRTVFIGPKASRVTTDMGNNKSSLKIFRGSLREIGLAILVT